MWALWGCLGLSDYTCTGTCISMQGLGSRTLFMFVLCTQGDGRNCNQTLIAYLSTVR